MNLSPAKVWLRAVEPGDFASFLTFHNDPEARWQAAFGSAEPMEPVAFQERWATILANPATRNRTIVADGEVAGYVGRFEQIGRASVSYWVGRSWWSRGVATLALAAFLAELNERPLYARVVKDNAPSLRVLEKSGFRLCGEDRAEAPARGTVVEEWILELR